MAANALATLGILVLTAGANANSLFNVKADAVVAHESAQKLIRHEKRAKADRGGPQDMNSKEELESKLKHLEDELEQVKKQAASAATVSAAGTASSRTGGSTAAHQGTRHAIRRLSPTNNLIPSESNLDVDEQQNAQGCDSPEHQIVTDSNQKDWCEQVCTGDSQTATQSVENAGFTVGSCSDAGYTVGPSFHHIAAFKTPTAGSQITPDEAGTPPTAEQIRACKNRDAYFLKNSVCEELCLHSTQDEQTVVADMATFEPGACPSTYSEFISVGLAEFWVKPGNSDSAAGSPASAPSAAPSP